MNCLVLGGAGFIGRQVMKDLAAAGHAPVAAGRNSGAGPYVELATLGNRESLFDVLDHVECVIHLAWATVPSTASAKPIADVQENVLGSLRLFDCCVERKVRRVVFCSTGGAIYGKARALPVAEDHPTMPITSYGVTKLATEAYLRMFGQLHGLEFVILRPGNAYGEGQRATRKQGIIASCLDAALNGTPLEIWGDGTVVRDYVHVADISSAVTRAVATEAHSITCNIGTGTGHSVNEIIDVCRKVTGRPIEVRYVAGRAIDVHDNVLDARVAHARLGWRPRIELPDGIARQWTWLLGEQPAGTAQV